MKKVIKAIKVKRGGRMKSFTVSFHEDASAANSGKAVEFNDEFYGWEKTTSTDDRQMKFGDLGTFPAVGGEENSNSSF
jgi:hypothetical protein